MSDKFERDLHFCLPSFLSDIVLFLVTTQVDRLKAEEC